MNDHHRTLLRLVRLTAALALVLGMLVSTPPARTYAAGPGAVIGWGSSYAAQLNGTSGIIAISAGLTHQLALKSDGTVIAWGYSGPELNVPAGLSGVTAVSAGAGFSLALKSDGTVVGWGDNSSGQLNIPAGLNNVIAISAGFYHSLALKSDGTVVGWGDNNYQQIAIPAGLSGVKAISAGGLHSLALKNDGTIVPWGTDAYGQSTIPASIQGSATAIADGYLHSIALKSDGTVVAWGNNRYGQLNIPGGLNNVVAVSTTAGATHSLALKGDGTVVGWGDNCCGQLNIPAGLKRVLAISAGGYQSVVLVSNQLPTAVNDSYSTNEDSALTINAPGVLASDVDADGDALTAIKESEPAHGTVALNADGSFTYTPAANYNGPDSFSYRANDGLSNSPVATVNINVNAVNDAPTTLGLSNSSVAENEATGTTVGTFSSTDPDIGSTFTYSLVSGADSTDNASFAISGSTLRTGASFDYEAKNSYSIRVRSTDIGGLSIENVFTINVTDVAENVAPEANNDSFSTDEDTALTGNVLTNDSDLNGDALTAVKVSEPAHGAVALNADGSFTYTPAANYNGPDSFSYKASDGELDSSAATVNITVNAVNDAPTASDEGYSTDEDTALTISAPGVLSNDGDLDGDTLTAVMVSEPGHGTVALNADGSFTYTPAANYNGPDSFSYRASDGTASSNVATVSLTVNPVNDAPTAAVAAGGVCLADFRGQATLTIGDVEAAASSLSLSRSSSNPTLVPIGNITFGGSGASRTVTIATASGKSGSATITIAVSDGASTSTTTITVFAGTSNNDTLTGTSGADMLFGGNSQDTLQGNGGNDLLCGGQGDDTLTGGDGADTLDAGSGQDKLDGGAGNDALLGGRGDDTLAGGDGEDALRGGDGNDKLDGGANNDRLYGEQGDDTLTGGAGADRLDGGPNNDRATDLNASQGDTQVNIP